MPFRHKTKFDISIRHSEEIVCKIDVKIIVNLIHLFFL